VASSIALPNGHSVQYQYLNGQLSEVLLPDGTSSSFSAEYEPNSECTVLNYDDAAADGTHRRKRAYLTNNFSILVSKVTNIASIWNNASMLVRMVVNGDNEITYLNIPHPTMSWVFKIYEGAGRVKINSDFRQVRYYKDGWTFNPNGGYDAFTGELEDTYVQDIETGDYYEVRQRRRIPETVDAHGVSRQYEYHDNDYIWKVKYSDGSYDEYSYNNPFQLLTRYKDRNNHVTKYTYDERGNMLTKEIGILCVNGTDTNQPEHAVYQWEYYPAGHQNQYLLKTEYDALGNPSLDTHRTDYIYDANQRLVQVIQGADVPGGTRGVTTYVYDSAGRLYSVIDPVARQVDYLYDAQSRVSTIVYHTCPGTCTERFIYGAPGTPDANLLVKKVNKNGVVTKYEYDGSGRRVKTIEAYATMDELGNETLITDPNVRLEETVAYLPGTSLQTQVVRAGNKTDFTYDYRYRQKSTTAYPRAGVALTSAQTHVNNLLFCSQDRHGFKTYYAYRASDRARIRTVRGLVTGFSLPDFAAVEALTRSTTPNPDYVIEDVELDDSGDLVARIDGRGIRQEMAYDSRGQVVSQVAAFGAPSDGERPSVAAKTEFEYDAQGNQVRVIRPRSFAVDAAGTAFSRPGPEGDFITQVVYNGRNNVANRTEAFGRPEAATEQYSYYLDGRVKDRIDPRGYDWTTRWRKCCTTIVAESDPLDYVDDSGILKCATRVSGTDAFGNATYSAVIKDIPATPTQEWYRNPPEADTVNESTTRFDARNRPVARTVWLVPLSVENAWINPPIAGEGGIPPEQGLTTRWAYDENLTDGIGLDVIYGAYLAGLGLGEGAAGSMVEETSPAGRKSISISDAIGRAVRAVKINGGVATSVTVDNVLDETENGIVRTRNARHPNGLGGGGDIISSILTDGSGRVRVAKDAEDHETLNSYDQNGNLITTRDPNGVGHDITLDARNREISCVDTNGDCISWKKYDADSNIVTMKDTLNHTTAIFYDGHGNKVTSVDRLGGMTIYRYDNNRNLVEIHDADAHARGDSQPTTVYRYNSRNLNVLSAHRDDTVEAFFTQSESDFNQFDTDDRRYYKYDAAHRLINRVDQLGDSTIYDYNMANRLVARRYPDALNDNYTYDPDGPITCATSNRYNNSVSRCYDNTGRLISDHVAIDNNIYTVSNVYDAAGRMVREYYPNGQFVGRTYTPRDLVSSIEYNGVAVVTSITYDSGGREISRVLANGLTQIATWRTDNRPLSISTLNTVSLSYTFDSNKRLKSEINAQFPSQNIFYDSYDALGHITKWIRGAGADNQLWDVSINGDWQEYNINTEGYSISETRVHNPAHELLSINKSATQNTINYDHKGNMTSNIYNHNYTWDYDNKINLVELAVAQEGTTQHGIPGTHNYRYDALGRRVAKTVNGKLTLFINNSNWQTLHEISSDGKTRTHIYGQYIDEPICTYSDNESYFYIRSINGSINSVTDANGICLERYSYDAFGGFKIFNCDYSLQLNKSIFDNTFFYSGRQYDYETGNMYFRNRYYNSYCGRFLSRDDLGYIDGLNLYHPYFVPNGVDPLGLSWLNLGNNIWMAGKDDGSLQELAQLVTGNAEDWTCIWPIPTWQEPQKYPKAKYCDKADVENLKLTEGPSYKARFLSGLGESFDFGGSRLYSFTHLALQIKNTAQSGKTPIRNFQLLAHGGAQAVRDGPSFTVEELDKVSFLPNNTNWYHFATDKTGPRRCWFTRNATMWFHGCSSALAARHFASHELRNNGAIAWGLQDSLSNGMGSVLYVSAAIIGIWNVDDGPLGARWYSGLSESYYRDPNWRGFFGLF
jgi:RHS repeat-associated protein